MALNTPVYGRSLGFASPPLILNNDGFFNSNLISHKLYHMIPGRPKAKDEPAAKESKAISDSWAILSDDESGDEGTARKLRGHRKKCKPGCSKDHDYSHAKDLARRLRVLEKNPDLVTEQLEMRFTEVDRLADLKHRPDTPPTNGSPAEIEPSDDSKERTMATMKDFEMTYEELLRMCTIYMIASISAIAHRQEGKKAWRRSAESRREAGCAVWQAWDAQNTMRSRMMKSRRKSCTIKGKVTSCCQSQFAHRNSNQNFMEDLWKEGEQDYVYHYADGCMDCIDNVPAPRGFNSVMGLQKRRLTDPKHIVYNSILHGDVTAPPLCVTRPRYVNQLSGTLHFGIGMTLEQRERQLQRRALAIRSIPRLVFHALAREEAKLLYFQILFAPYGMAPVADYDPALDMRANAENNVRKRWARLDKAVKKLQQRAMMDDPDTYSEYAFPFGNILQGFRWPHEWFKDAATGAVHEPVRSSFRFWIPPIDIVEEPELPRTRPNDVVQIELEYSTRVYTRQAQFCQETRLRGHTVDLLDINGGLRVAQGFVANGEIGYGVYEWPHEKMAREEVILGESVEMEMARQAMKRTLSKPRDTSRKTCHDRDHSQDRDVCALVRASAETAPEEDEFDIMGWIHAQMHHQPSPHGEQVAALMKSVGQGTQFYRKMLEAGLAPSSLFTPLLGHDPKMGAEECTNHGCCICWEGNKDDSDMVAVWRKAVGDVRRAKANGVVVA